MTHDTRQLTDAEKRVLLAGIIASQPYEQLSRQDHRSGLRMFFWAIVGGFIGWAGIALIVGALMLLFYGGGA